MTEQKSESEIELGLRLQEKVYELGKLMQDYHKLTGKFPVIGFNHNEYFVSGCSVLNVTPEISFQSDPIPTENDLSKMRNLTIDLLEGVDLLMKKEFIIQPFLRVVLKHQEIISKYKLLEKE